MRRVLVIGISGAGKSTFARELARRSGLPLIHLDNLPAFEQVCAASGGYGERVEDPAALPGALERAIRVVTEERRQALLNVICDAPGGPL